MTIKRAAKVLGVSHRGATMNVAKLVEAGILAELPTSGRTKLFLATEVLDTVNGSAT